jgi:hypothetical protein
VIDFYKDLSATSTVGDAISDGIVSSMAGDAMNNALGSSIPGFNFSDFISGEATEKPPFTAGFSTVTIDPEGITLQGVAYVDVPIVPFEPGLFLSGSVNTTQSQVVGSGVYHSQLWCMPEAKDYPYTEYAQQQTATYSLGGRLVGQPLTPHCTIATSATSDTEVPLSGNNGTVELSNVNTHYAMR